MMGRADELTPPALGAVLGTAVAALVAPLVRPLFHAPAGGVGWITIHQYPKTWDYAVAALILIGSFAGAAALSRRPDSSRSSAPGMRRRWVAVAIAVFALTVAIDDTPNAPLDFFHEGERLTPAFLLRSGQRPYRDVFFFHGLATDGGLTRLVMGDPPSPVRARRLEWILGAATLALLAPIAAEVCATSTGVALATFASFCAVGAGVRVFFPYFRLAPLLLAVFGLLRYLRTRRSGPLILAAFAATAGLVWSIDAGIFAVVATFVLVVAIHILRLGNATWTKLTLLGIGAALLPVIVLIVMRADLRLYFTDTFITLPRGAFINTIPQPELPKGGELLYWLDTGAAKYYIPLIVYGLTLAIAVVRWRGGDRVRAAQIAVLTTFSVLLFRSAAGRADANHIAFAMPLFGIMVVAFLIEPLAMRRRVLATIIASLLFIGLLDATANSGGIVDALTHFPERHRHDGLVPYPLRSATDMYATPQVARDLGALNRYTESLGPDAQFLDVANNRALYYLLERKPAVRCPDVMMWCDPAVVREEMSRLERNRPAFVVLDGYAQSAMDDIPYGVRVPALQQWVDANYPRRLRFGRFVVAAR